MIGGVMQLRYRREFKPVFEQSHTGPSLFDRTLWSFKDSTEHILKIDQPRLTLGTEAKARITGVRLAK
jgi:hypothetical protein